MFTVCGCLSNYATFLGVFTSLVFTNLLEKEMYHSITELVPKHFIFFENSLNVPLKSCFCVVISQNAIALTLEIFASHEHDWGGEMHHVGAVQTGNLSKQARSMDGYLKREPKQKGAKYSAGLQMRMRILQ